MREFYLTGYLSSGLKETPTNSILFVKKRIMVKKHYIQISQLAFHILSIFSKEYAIIAN